MIITVLLTNYIVCFWLIIYQTRVSHDLIITDNSYRSCLILIYTACRCCVHASCHETAKGLAISSSPKNYVRGPVQGVVFHASRIFEPGKRMRVGICDDSSEPSLLPYTKYGCLAERINVVYLTCSSLRQPSIFFFSSFIFNFLFSLLKFIYILLKVYTKRPLLKTFSLEKCAKI